MARKDMVTGDIRGGNKPASIKRPRPKTQSTLELLKRLNPQPPQPLSHD